MDFDSSSLAKYSNQLSYIKSTADQVIKDFGFFSHEISFSGNEHTAYNELFHQILPLVTHLVDKDFASFCNLLYRIDLPEQRVRKMMQQSKDFYVEITNAILQRELQKVVIRAHFHQAATEDNPPRAIE